MSGLIALKSLPCVTALLLSGSYVRQTSRFYYELNDLIKNESARLDWHFNDPSRRKFQFFFFVTNENTSEVYYQYQCGYNLPQSQPMPYSSFVRVPAEYMQGDKLHLYFGVVSTTSDDWGDHVYLHETLGSRVSKYDINGLTSVSTGRHYCESDIYGVRRYNLYYTFEYLDEIGDTFSLHIENWIFRYVDSSGRVLPATCTVELRLLDHLSEWQIGSKIGGSNGYVSIPMVLERDEVEDGYRVITKDRHVYNKLTGQMQRYSTLPSSTYFYTRNILASGIGNPSNREYRYQVIFNDVNGGDFFMIDKTIRLGGLHYGNCNEADYCVVIGGE